MFGNTKTNVLPDKSDDEILKSIREIHKLIQQIKYNRKNGGFTVGVTEIFITECLEDQISYLISR